MCVCVCVCVCMRSAMPDFLRPMDCEIFQARILEWVAIASVRIFFIH